ncbi:MAG: Fe-S cluster assembly protein SufD [Anaerolineaceae bacterium]|nr:Fe-S cluster assembly protein SufD [Anaerolineaceae bacterium]
METPSSLSKPARVGSTAAADFQFLPAFPPALPGTEYLAAYRRRAWELFQGMPVPTTQDEAWRRTDLRGLNPQRFQLPQPGAALNLPPAPDELLRPVVNEVHGGQLVLTPNASRVQLDPELAARGVVFCDLAEAEQIHPELLERALGRIVRAEEGKFAALAAAFAQQGVLLYVPKGVTLDQPLHSLVWGGGADLAFLTQVVVYLEEGASATYVHESASPQTGAGETLHCGTVEIFVGPSASLRFVELQSWGKNVWNFSHERARVERDGNLDWIFGAIGSRLTKNFSDIDLAGTGSTGRISGFYFTDDRQHLDHDTQQNHLAPNTTSDLLYKGALLGNSRSVWQGMIYVAPGAAKTDGYQANRNLVLSNTARADSIPGLEILADDVRCTHGATVGKIDEDQIFYLRSRGLKKSDAERLLVDGFFDPIMQRIPFEGVRTRFQDAIQLKMAAYSEQQ